MPRLLHRPAARRTLSALLLLAALAPFVAADEARPARRTPSADRGLRALTETAYLPPSFDQETFDAVWRVWPEPLRTEAEAADAATRRRMAYARYGLTERPDDGAGRPLQYVVDAAGNWSMSCLTCHAGSVADRIIPGLPNTHIALQTLGEEIRDTKRLLGKPLNPGEQLLGLFPLGTTNGTTNAVMFSVSLLSLRDKHLELTPPKVPPRFVHHDLDAPAWWNVRKRSHFYIDGFAPKGHRALMQFTLVPQTGPDDLARWEEDFRDILAYLESLEPPAWPYEVDATLAERGRAVFERTCAACHGTYGEAPTYPNRRVPLATIGTDPLRLEAITASQRERYANSWLTHYDPEGVVVDPGGYVAPPLDGVWATAPYFHNGSVPTLWHVLHPDERPAIWRRSGEAYDRERAGLAVEALEALPPEARADPKRRRSVFDTSARGKSAAGHRFPDVLGADEKRAVLEYLKTL